MYGCIFGLIASFFSPQRIGLVFENGPMPLRVKTDKYGSRRPLLLPSNVCFPYFDAIPSLVFKESAQSARMG